jgi:hypothetical protein
MNVNSNVLTTISVPSTVAAVQAEIQKNGPVSAAISPCCQAFMTYVQQLSNAASPYAFSGDCNSDPNAGGHAIQIVGWAVVGGVPSWKIRNSWGNLAGYNGYFFLPLNGGPSSLNILSNVWTVLAGTQTAAAPPATAAPTAAPTTASAAAHTTAAPTVATTQAAGAEMARPMGLSTSDDDDLADIAHAMNAPNQLPVTIVDFDGDAARRALRTRTHDLVGETRDVDHPEHHEGVQHAIHHYLHHSVPPGHQVTSILWAARQVPFSLVYSVSNFQSLSSFALTFRAHIQVVAGSLYKVLFNTIDSASHTFVHKIVIHEPASNRSGTKQLLSGLMVRTGTFAATPAASSSTTTSSFSGGQVAGIAIACAAGGIILAVAAVAVLNRRMIRVPNQPLQEALLHQGDD